MKDEEAKQQQQDNLEIKHTTTTTNYKHKTKKKKQQLCFPRWVKKKKRKMSSSCLPNRQQKHVYLWPGSAVVWLQVEINHCSSPCIMHEEGDIFIMSSARGGVIVLQ